MEQQLFRSTGQLEQLVLKAQTAFNEYDHLRSQLAMHGQTLETKDAELNAQSALIQALQSNKHRNPINIEFQ